MLATIQGPFEWPIQLNQRGLFEVRVRSEQRRSKCPDNHSGRNTIVKMGYRHGHRSFENAAKPLHRQARNDDLTLHVAQTTYFRHSFDRVVE